MVAVYAIALSFGVMALLVVILGGTLAQNLDKPERDPNTRLGPKGRAGLGALLGFGMGGMAAEFSPIGLSWPVALVLALVAALAGAIWVRFVGPTS